MTGSPEDAADLTQEAFRKAFKNWDRFGGRSETVTWLYSILVNCVRDWARKKALRTAEPLDEWDIVAVGGGQGDLHGLDRLQKDEQLMVLREAISKLTPTLRSAFAPCVLDGYTYEETASLLNVPVGTVASRVGSARKQLFAVMRETFSEAQS